MTADSWWVRDNGHKTGPHTAADLRRLAREGKVLPSTQVSPDQTRWMAASAKPRWIACRIYHMA